MTYAALKFEALIEIVYIGEYIFAKISLISDRFINTILNKCENEMYGVIGYDTVPRQM